MMNCGNNENKNKKVNFFTRMKNRFNNERDEYIKNTSYKRFLYNIEDTLNAIFYLFLTFFILFGAFVLCKVKFYKNLEEYNNSSLVSASAKSINDVSNFDTITDLTGTSWEINSNITATAGYGQFDINYYIIDIPYTTFYIGYGIGGRPPSLVPLANTIVDCNLIFFANDGTWEANNPVSFVGGTDVTNSNLISWLQSNATLQSSQPSQLTTPVLSSTLVVQTGVDLYWTYDSSISTPYSFEIYKDDTLLTTTNSSFYTITSNGTYKVRQLGDDNSYTDSEFSNSVTITGLTHFTFNLGNNVSARTRFSLSSDDITLSDFYYLYNNYSFVIYFEIDNNNANTGYVFTSVNDFSTNSSVTYNTIFPNNEKLVVNCSSLTAGDFICSVTSHSATKISGKTYIYDNQLSTNDLSIGDYLIKNRSFVSNEKSFDNIYVNQYNYLVYDNISTENDDVVYFLSNLTGQYISNSTFNYYLLTFDTLSAENNYSIQNYLSEDDIFFDYYRLATQSDLDNITVLNEQLVTINENYTFLSLFGSIIDAHFNTIKSLINFNLFGINLWSIFTLILTLALVYMVYKFLHGGRKE